MAANGKAGRKLASWIDSYVEYTSATPAPEIFRLWSGLGTLSAALERRVYVNVANQITYPNLFILLVGRPGVGKSNAINPATSILREALATNIAPKDTTKASFLKWLASDEARDRISVKGELYEYHSTAIQISEFGVFVRAHELDLLSLLCELYDCPDSYQNKRIYQGKDVIDIPRPQVSILAGTQPGYLASVFPAEAWSQGFMARVILIHSGEPSRPSLFSSKPLDTKLQSALIHDLAHMKQLEGEFTFTEEAKTAIETWYNNGEAGSGDAPNYPRLSTYVTRRIVHLLKLCMTSSAARSDKLLVELEDFEIAHDWMLKAEAVMPDVFLEMAGRSDSDTIRELWHYAWTYHVSKQKAGLGKSRLMTFLSVRVPAWSADKILELAVSAGYFKVEGGFYIPIPKQEWATI